LRHFDIANGGEERGRGRDGGVRRHLRRDEAAQRLTRVPLVRRVLARGRAMIVAGVLGMNGRAVAMIHVVEELMRDGGCQDDRSRRGGRQSNQRERKNEMGQGEKQAHGPQTNDAADLPQPCARKTVRCRARSTS
jgi:hypothetical protein